MDSLYRIQNQKNEFDTSAYVNIGSRVVKEKFCFGLSNYKVSENWIAFISGKILWPHFASIVIPDDILKHSEGLCSQQTIVFMELLKQKQINVRAVGLGLNEGPGHFLCEVHYNNSWRLHDVTKEPHWNSISNDHKSMDFYLLNKDSLYKVYHGKIAAPLFYKIIKTVRYGYPNDFPAKKMKAFHIATKLLTYFLPLFFLLMTIRNSPFMQKRARSIKTKGEPLVK
ncbi:MAG: hypothetical protein JWO32_1365 [Bacteroidetes bacterium]|nr:hypothetical protein [Bacteroidota bacterium]